MEAIGAVILAAGGSTRLGQPKQLLRYRGETLIRHIASAALSADCRPTLVVTGDAHGRVATELSGLDLRLLHHPEWQRGIGSSIRVGVEGALSEKPDLEGLFLLLCDQPFVSTPVLSALIAARGRASPKTAACSYAGTVGVPALFDRAHFPALRSLPDEEGAKSLLVTLAGKIATVEFPAGAIDIDTPEDWKTHGVEGIRD